MMRLKCELADIFPNDARQRSRPGSHQAYSHPVCVYDLSKSNQVHQAIHGERFLPIPENTTDNNFIDNSLLSETNPVKRAGRASKIAGLTLALMLSCVPLVHAQPHNDGAFGGSSEVVGPDPFPDRCPDSPTLDDIRQAIRG
jgi:hypothetical protein